MKRGWAPPARMLVVYPAKGGKLNRRNMRTYMSAADIADVVSAQVQPPCRFPDDLVQTAVPIKQMSPPTPNFRKYNKRIDTPITDGQVLANCNPKRPLHQPP